MAAEDERRPTSPDAADRDSVANVRFSAHIVAKTDLTQLLPFALIAPEGSKRRKRPVSEDSHELVSPFTPAQSPDDDTIPPTPVSVHSARLPYLQGPPDDLKGIFVRKFRWGTVDVLDPNHCDFAALRTAVLSTHLKVCISCIAYAGEENLISQLQLLKNHTKEVLYEKYRTEKLLARRATRNISDDDRQRLLEGKLLIYFFRRYLISSQI